jgi:hypothetical protein
MGSAKAENEPKRLIPLQVERWFSVEPLASGQVAALYGTSAEICVQIIKTGRIPSAPEEKLTLQYQQRLKHSGHYFYYSLPVYDNIQTMNSFLASRLERKHMLQNSMGLLSFDNQYLSAREYAIDRAMEDYFTTQTGISVDFEDILILAYEHNKQLFHDFIKRSSAVGLHNSDSIRETRQGSTPDTLRKIHEKFTASQIHQLVLDSLERRGFVLFYNDQILQNSHLTPEDSEEIVSVRATPLTASALLGMRPLSLIDKVALTDSL